jgi:hypothetical protein
MVGDFSARDRSGTPQQRGMCIGARSIADSPVAHASRRAKPPLSFDKLTFRQAQRDKILSVLG